MRLVTKFELAAKSENDLYAIHKEAYIGLIKSNPRSLERINALLSLRNIELELASRVPHP